MRDKNSNHEQGGDGVMMMDPRHQQAAQKAILIEESTSATENKNKKGPQPWQCQATLQSLHIGITFFWRGGGVGGGSFFLVCVNLTEFDN